MKKTQTKISNSKKNKKKTCNTYKSHTKLKTAHMVSRTTLPLRYTKVRTRRPCGKTAHNFVSFSTQQKQRKRAEEEERGGRERESLLIC
jgi:hypothetical protein